MDSVWEEGKIKEKLALLSAFLSFWGINLLFGRVDNKDLNTGEMGRHSCSLNAVQNGSCNYYVLPVSIEILGGM